MRIYLVKLLVFTFFVSICNQTFAQDVLYKTDNTKVEAKIIEITPTTIKYNLFNYQEGPLITIDKKDVALIVFQNGTHEVIKVESGIQNSNVIIINDTHYLKNRTRDSTNQVIWKERTIHENYIGLNCLSLFNSGFELNYLREMKKINMNIYEPFQLGFASPKYSQPSIGLYTSYNGIYKNFQFTKKVIETGIGIHFHTSGKRAITHFIGPYIGIAQLNGTFEEHFSNYQPNNSTIIKHAFVMNRYYAMIDNGVLFRITNQFNILTLFSVGYFSDDFIKNNPSSYHQYGWYNNLYNFPFFNAVKINFSMGYRF